MCLLPYATTSGSIYFNFISYLIHCHWQTAAELKQLVWFTVIRLFKDEAVLRYELVTLHIRH